MNLRPYSFAVLAALLLLTVLHAPSAIGQVPAALAQPSLQLMTNGTIDAIAVAPDGSIVFGGKFTFVNGVPRTNIARLQPDGSLDLTWDPGCDGEVKALAVGSDGTVFVGGTFFNIGGGQRSYLAKLEGTGTGTLDPDWDARSDQEVDALAIDGDGFVYAGGKFQEIGGQLRALLAKLSASGSGDADPNWNPAPDGSVSALALDNNGSIYVAGEFLRIAGQPRTYIAKLSTSGTGAVDSSWNAGFFDNLVFAIAVDGNQSVFIAGGFQSVAGHYGGTIAKLSASNGVVDQNWTTTIINSTVALALDGSGAIYAGGWDATIHKLSTSGTGQPVATWNVGPLEGSSVHGQVVSSLAVVNSKVVVGGDFTGIGGHTRLGLGVLSTTGSPLSSTDIGNPGTVYAVALQPGGGIIAGGDFYLAGAFTPRHHLLRLTSSGQLDPNWVANTDGFVYALAFDSNGSVYIGGQFLTVNGVQQLDLAKLSGTTGAIDASWVPTNAGYPDRAVYSLAVDSSGAVYAGGDFLFSVMVAPNVYQGYNYVARFSGTTGAVDQFWDPLPDHPVTAVVIDGTGAVFLGGLFQKLQSPVGGYRNYLAKLGQDGTLDPDWNPAPDSYVHSLALDGTGNIYVGGSFGNIGGQPHFEIARVSTAGSGPADVAWNPSVPGFYFGVHSLALSANGNIYAGGAMFINNQTGGGPTGGAIVKIPTAVPGSVDISWHPAPDGPINALAIGGDGSVYAGGSFTEIGGAPRNALAALPPTAPDEIFKNGFE